MIHKILFVITALLVVSCAADKTAEEACKNAGCPAGTVIELTAASASACEGSASGTQIGGASTGEASGACYTSGTCAYACYAVSVCCGEEEWTLEAYSCTQACCADGNPPPCETACGDGECEPGEVCNMVSCPEDSTCSECKDDCCSVCGNGECEYGESPAKCAVDCGGDVCVPDCEGRFCGTDGCGGQCGAPCPAGKKCSTKGICVKIEGECTPDCADKECGDDGCGGTCGDCPNENDECNDGVCQPDCQAICKDKEPGQYGPCLCE